MLYSATQTTKVTDLARISLRPGPIFIDVDKEESTSTVSTLTQGYVVCASDTRFRLLYLFLKKNMKKKVSFFELRFRQILTQIAEIHPRSCSGPSRTMSASALPRNQC